MKSILLTLMLTLVSLNADTAKGTQNEFKYTVEVAEHFKPYVCLENKLDSLKIDLKDLAIGATGKINEFLSYSFKYSSSQKLYNDLKIFYDKFSDIKTEEIKTSALYVNLNLRF